MAVLKDQFDIERWVDEAWKTIDFNAVKGRNEGKEKKHLLDGPPFLSGSAHLGHLYNKTIKDALYRYWLMRGYDVDHQWGWDSQGLPIEKQVEKRLGITNKRQIEAMGVNAFNDECRAYIEEVRQRMTGQFTNHGSFLADPEDYYITCANGYVEKVWRMIKQAHEKGLLYKGKKVLSYCPTCETTLAATEMQHETRHGVEAYVKFPVRNENGRYLLVWTTTPWTLKANTNVAVNPSASLVEVDAGEGRWVLGKDQFELLRDRIPALGTAEVQHVISPKQMEGLQYTNPIQRPLKGRPRKNYHSTVLADFVGSEGTGIVHVAPAHGPDDHVLGKRLSLSSISVLGDDGKYQVSGYEGLSLDEVNKRILDELRDREMYVTSGDIEHSVGTCWRCHTPTVYLPSNQMFLGISKMRKDLSRLADAVEITPEQGRTRFADWLKKAEDWCITRQRYWGTPAPIWECGQCDDEVVIGSVAELQSLYGRKLPAGFDLHRPYIDGIKLGCTNGHEMSRIPDVLDVWLDSGVAFSLLHGDAADYIVEGHDQTRGWFYSMLASGEIMGLSPPYKHVNIHGFIVDEHGEKMSKSKGNVIDPASVHAQYSKDMMRFYYLTHAAFPDFRYNVRDMREVYKAFNSLVNCLDFALTYMEIDGYKGGSSMHATAPEDQWITSRVNNLTKEVSAAVDSDQLDRASRAITSFITDDLSQGYIPLVREAAWKGDKGDARKLDSYATLSNVFNNLARVMTPFAPQTAEYVYQMIGRQTGDHARETVQLEDWPQEAYVDEDLERSMATARSIIGGISALRARHGIKKRQPLEAAYLVAQDAGPAEAIERLGHVIRDRTNVRNLKISNHPELEDDRYAKISGPGYKIYLDTQISGTLGTEGYFADIRRGIQALRQGAGYDIMDAVDVAVSEDPDKLPERYRSELERVTKARITYGPMPAGYKTALVKTGYGEIQIGISSVRVSDS